VHNSPLIS